MMPVHASDTVLGANLLPANAIFARWRPFTLVALNAGQELALSVGVAPGVCLELPAPGRLHQGREVAMLTGLLERRVQVTVVTLQLGRVSVGRQHRADRRRGAGGTGRDLGTPGMRCGHRQLPADRSQSQHKRADRQESGCAQSALAPWALTCPVLQVRAAKDAAGWLWTLCCRR